MKDNLVNIRKYDESSNLIEPEIVGKSEYSDKDYNHKGFFFRLFFNSKKLIFLIISICLILSVLFIAVGFILSTTLIGLIIGLPAILIGFAGFFLTFNLLRLLIRFSLIRR